MYREEKTLSERLTESKLMFSRFADRIPIIVEKRKSQIRSIDKRKFMAPTTLSMAQFMFVIRKRLLLKPEEAIFVFVNDKILISSSMTVKETYDKYHDEDGFLYLTYDFENTFG